MADELDDIRSRISIVELVGQSVNLKRTGKYFEGLCPFHDDRRPSFRLSETTGRYKCWACGEHGDIFTWVMKTQNLTFRESVEILAQRAGVILRHRKPEDVSLRQMHQAAMKEALVFFREELTRSSSARAYCEARGLGAEIVDAWELGYAPDVGSALAVHLQKKGFKLAECEKLFLVQEDGRGGYFDKFRSRLIFPIRDEKGDLVAFGGRILGDGHPKYINSSDTPLYRKSRVLYGLYKAKDVPGGKQPPVLCEGYLDVIACHAAGVKTAVASLGTALSEEHAKLLSRWSRTQSVTILYDADEAGQKAAARASDILETEGLKVRVALMPPGQDPDTLLQQAGPAAVQRAAEAGLTPTEFKIKQVEAKQQPDSEQFWDLVIEVLAECRNELEVATHLQYLAPRYPHLRDPIEAAKALGRMVRARRKPKAGPATERARPPTEIPKPKLGMKAVEATLFRALLQPDYRRAAWLMVTEPDLLLTGRAVELAQVLKQTFGETPPRGKASEWLHQLPEDAQATLADVDLAKEERFTDDLVLDSLTLLAKKREERALEQLKQDLEGDDRLRILNERLKKRHGEDRV